MKIDFDFKMRGSVSIECPVSSLLNPNFAVAKFACG
jgi:hypothetical protein